MATNPLDLYEPDILPTGNVRDAVPTEPHTSGIKAFAKSAALSTAPTAGGLAAVPAGATAGGGLGLLVGGGTPAEAITVPAGVIIGGGATALGMGWVIDKAQTRLIHAAPLSLQQSLGIDDATLARERAQHPVASFLGANAPAVLAFRPSWGGWKAALAGGAINSGIQTAQDLASGGGFDPLHSTVAFGIGATFGHNNPIGDFLQRPGTWAVERIATGAGRTQAEQGAADTIAAGLSEHGAPGDPDPARAGGRLRTVAGEHLTPDEQAAIHVANDAAVTRETSPFQPGPAGDREHGLRLGSTLQAILDGTPLPPIGAESAAHAAGPVPFDVAQGERGMETAKARIAAHESGGSYTAHNPQPGQTASGKYQFTDASWKGFAREVYASKSDADLMAMKADPAAQEKVMDHALASYGRQLRAAGAPETPGNLYLLHFLGPRGLDVLRADASTPIEALLPANAIAANRAWLQGKSAGELVRDMAARAGGDLTATVHAERLAADPEAQDPALQAFAEGNDAAIVAEAARREGVAADIAADNAPAKEIATRGPRVRKGPVDLATFIADRGGLADDEGHSLAEGRNLQQKVPGAGNLIKPTGMSVDAAGELLWDHGYFGPPETTPRPSEAEVLDLLEQTKSGKIYHPEDAMRMADEAAAAQAAQPPEHDEVRSFLADKIDEMGLQLHDEDLDAAAQDVVAGVPWDRALERAIVSRFGETKLDVEGETGEPFWEGEGDGFSDEPGWPAEDGSDDGPGGQSPGPDHGDAGESGPGLVEPAGLARLAGEARGDSVALERFDQPAGEGIDAQIESLEHDLRMAVGETVKATVPAGATDEKLLSTVFVKAKGEPGFQIEETHGDGTIYSVFRDKNGEAKGVVRFPATEDARHPVADYTVPMAAYVDPAFRRQGIATKLYDQLRHAGLAIDALSGTEDLTPDGAAFVNARRAALQADTKVSTFRLDPEGGETTAAGVLEHLDADEKAWGELRACLPAKVTA